MPLTNAGRDQMAAALVGLATTPFDAAHARLGLGNSSAAFAATQTDLQGGSKLRKGLEATYPRRSANRIQMSAVFGLTEANFAWNEWGVFNAATGGLMLCRAVHAFGSKPADQTWKLAVAITVEIA